MNRRQCNNKLILLPLAVLKENEAVMKSRSDLVKKKEGSFIVVAVVVVYFFKVVINIDRGRDGEAGLNSLGLKRGCL